MITWRAFEGDTEVFFLFYSSEIIYSPTWVKTVQEQLYDRYMYFGETQK